MSQNLKSLVLAVCIVIGAGMNATALQAAQTETLTVAGGCFWCVESDFESVTGVHEVISGYTGGTLPNPTYKQVTKGGSGHYEAVEIHFDPAQISRKTLLEMFVRSIDPTDSGGQFCDRGDSYRTAIFVSNSGESAVAKQVIQQAGAELGLPIVTPVLNKSPFYPAEGYHQDYYKGTGLVLTRGGPKRQSSAYKFYRKACGRDQKVKELWGKTAPFAKTN